MSAALRVATVTPRALPHRAASGATAGPSRDPHPRWARLGPRRRATPTLPESTRRLSAERTRATARASTTDESSPSSGGEARQNTTDGVARIARREALARVEASLNRNDDWRNVLAVIEDASRASGVPPARCVRTTRLWGHAGARWDLPAVLAVLRALDGADFAACVRAVGEKGGARDALEVYKEGIKAGYHRDDGGASRAAMAWVHDGIGQGKQADALWVDMHAEARLGRVDVAKCARVAAGLNNWNRGGSTTEGSVTTPGRRQLCRRRRTDDSPILPRFGRDPRIDRVHRGGGVRAGDRLEGPPAPARSRGCVRASATAAEKIAREFVASLENPGANGAKNSSLRSTLPARVYTAACRAASALRIPASRVTSRWTSSATAIASRTITWWRRWRPSSERRERPPPPTPWRRSFNRPDAEGTMRGVQRVPMEVPTVTTTVMTVITVSGARRGPASSERCAARAERLGRRNCWTRWRPSRSCAAGHRAPPRAARCPVTRRQAAAARGPPSSTSASGRMKKPTATAAAAWAADAKRARRAAAQRRAAAPAYAQLMHALLASRSSRRGARAALDVHAKMAAHGIAAPENPRHYRALYKAMLRGGGAGGRRMSPMQAAASCVADAVVRSEHLEFTTGSSSNVVKSRAASAARASLHVAAVAGLPDVSSRTLENLRAAGVAPVPEDLELTLEAFERAGTRRGRWRCGRRTSPRWTSSNESPSPYRGTGRDGRGAIKERMTPGAWAWAGWVANPRGGRGRP